MKKLLILSLMLLTVGIMWSKEKSPAPVASGTVMDSSEPKADPHMSGFWIVLIDMYGHEVWNQLSQGSSSNYTAAMSLKYSQYGGYRDGAPERLVPFYFMRNGVRYGPLYKGYQLTTIGDTFANGLFPGSGYYLVPVGYNYVLGLTYASNGAGPYVYSYQGPAVSGSASSYIHDNLRGDVDGNAVVNITDVTRIIDYLLMGDASSINQIDADCNRDGEISIVDVTRLIDYLLNGEWYAEIFSVNGAVFKMMPVEGGTFMMGATAEQGSADYEDDELPVHQVTLSSYSIGQTEVTQALWEAIMGSNPSYFTGDLQRPVERVSRDDCLTFITKLNQLTGRQFRLPTEAEWEFAARGGNRSKGYKYAGSNSIGNVAWYTSNSSSTTHAVATKSPNELGLYDMSGNVFEWCWDWYDFYSSAAQTNPAGPASAPYRVARGGCWSNEARFCRVSNRGGNDPSLTYIYHGLRLAL